MLQSGLYVGLSGQLALQRRMDTIAHNVANSSTAGFRAEEVKFESLISNTSSNPVAFASRGDTYFSRRAGEMVQTGNSLDVAIQGDAWFAMQTPAGTAYTRDGRLKMLPSGELQTLAGYPILDEGGAQLLVNPNGGPLQISKNGSIQQNGRQVGTLGLFTIDKAANLSRFDSSGVLTDRPAEPVADFSANATMQGYIERGNVNAVMEMSNLISVSRSFDAVTTALNEGENTMRDAIQALGAPAR